LADLRREDDCLSDHLAFGVGGNIDGIRAIARSTTNELAFIGRGPATMADVSLLDLAGICV